MKTMTLKEFHEALRAQGVPMNHIAFKCPICGTVQSPADLIEAGVGMTCDAVANYIGFSCVGRWNNAGPFRHPKKSAESNPPKQGCDWTLGGLFQLHKLEVVTEDGERCPRFEPCTPEEAQEHMKEKINVSKS